MYFYIEPEVGGGFGENSVVDASVHPPKVLKLHYQFDGWLGDDLLETFPCYIISEFLSKKVRLANLTGYEIDVVEVSISGDFIEFYSGKELPNFYWLKITGVAEKDDFGVSEDNRLVVSEKALKTLMMGKIDAADVENVENS